MLRHRVVAGAAPWSVRMAPAPIAHVEGDRLGVGPQAAHLVDFWYEHDDQAPQIERRFVAVGTGQEIPEGARYWGSTARSEQERVFHLFELQPLPAEGAG